MVPDSLLKKKSSAAYHYAIEGVRRDEWCKAYMKTQGNPANIFTKALPSGSNRNKKEKKMLYGSYSDQ